MEEISCELAATIPSPANSPAGNYIFSIPGGNMLELRDPTWMPGMPMPTYDEIVIDPADDCGKVFLDR